MYRSLSEFVHGNNETWTRSGLELVYNEDLVSDFFTYFHEVCEVVLFTLSIRYLKNIDKDNLDFLGTELSHIEPIRIYLGTKIKNMSTFYLRTESIKQKILKTFCNKSTRQRNN